MFWITEESNCWSQIYKALQKAEKCIKSFYFTGNNWEKSKSFFSLVLLSWADGSDRRDLSDLSCNVLLVIILLSARDISDMNDEKHPRLFWWCCWEVDSMMDLPLYRALSPSLLTVCPRQSHVPLYRGLLADWVWSLTWKVDMFGLSVSVVWPPSDHPDPQSDTAQTESRSAPLTPALTPAVLSWAGAAALRKSAVHWVTEQTRQLQTRTGPAVSRQSNSSHTTRCCRSQSHVVAPAGAVVRGVVWSVVRGGREVRDML